ncbi:hypothetical protein [Runella sp.]|uniref:hypothetical protein n=1 Tax=Runella sp. TaxID=1960881 RepID=UPI003D11745B
MKKFILLIVLIGIASFVGACAPAYVRNQPSPMNYDRPQRPSDNHVWRDGDWVWNRQSRAYDQRNGSWVMPKRGRSFKQGHWETNRRGQYWVKGQWD